MPRSRFVLACGGALAVPFFSSVAFGAASTAIQRIIVDLVVNAVPKHTAVAILRGNEVFVRTSDLARAGIQGLKAAHQGIDGEAYVALSTLPLTYELDEKAFVLRLTTGVAGLGSRVLRMKRPEVVYRGNTSAFLNYALQLENVERLGTQGELGLFAGGALFFSSVSGTYSEAEGGNVLRGLSSVTVDQRRALRRWVFGDSAPTAASALGGAAVIGGVSMATEFSLDPYLITFPVPERRTSVLTPSTVDVFLNGRLVRRDSLLPGHYEFRDLPFTVGAGTTRIVVRDAFGRETELTASSYISSGVLARGFSEYGYALGFRRDEFGTTSFAYGEPVFMGRHRYGFTDAFTGGLRLEASLRMASFGPWATFRLPIGEIELAAALSHDDGVSGGAGSVGYFFTGLIGSFGAQLRFMSDGYANTSQGAATDRPILQGMLLTSFGLAKNLSLTSTYALSSFRDRGRSDALTVQATTRFSKLASLAVLGMRSSDESGPTTYAAFGTFNFVFDGGAAVAVGYERRADEHVVVTNVSQSHSGVTGAEVNLTGEAARVPLFRGIGSYSGEVGRAELFYERQSGENRSRVSLSGGLVGIGGRVFPTRSVDESFALLRVPGVRGVRGYLSNLEIGRTDSQGDLLVPNLIPYYGNRVRVNDSDIPFTHEVVKNDDTIAPPHRGGAVVTFDVSRLQRISGVVTVVVRGKKVVPKHGELTVTVEKKAHASPIGSNGEFYFERLPAGSHGARVEFDEGTCAFVLRVPRSEAATIDVGGVECRMGMDKEVEKRKTR
ncbi:MAG: fimbrial biogenesis outer membrane usher protein [Deltaproteobacteria bacterium]|nr:fimbrial biogenesis outer membrane usher protein [Deltaproteobacteria bacterium]